MNLQAYIQEKTKTLERTLGCIDSVRIELISSLVTPASNQLKYTGNNEFTTCTL